MSGVELRGGLGKKLGPGRRKDAVPADHPLLKHFDAWQKRQAAGEFASPAGSTRTSQALSESSLRQYRSAWNSWVRHVMSHPEINGEEPRQSDLLGFLEQVNARFHTRTRSSKACSTTIVKYAKVLRSVYRLDVELLDTAKRLTRTELVGADLIEPGERVGDDPLVMNEHSWSLVLQKLQAAEDNSTDPRKLKANDLEGIRGVRDRAILSLICHDALQVGEIINMDTACVKPIIEESGERKGEAVHVRGLQKRRGSQERTQPLSTTSRRQIRDWRIARRTLLGEIEDARNTRMFVSIHPAEQRERTALSANAIYLIVTGFLKEALSNDEVAGYQRYMHVGPNTLRNCRLATWLKEGRSAAEVARLVGLKDARSIERIQRKALI